MPTPKPTDIVLRPMKDAQKAIAHYSCGILLHGYPAKPGEGKYVAQWALDKYGPKLFQQVDNAYQEVLRTGRESHLRVVWDADGAPVISLKERLMIWVPPGMN
jgi:hypothetical protein